jgi:hypothetical protein
MKQVGELDKVLLIKVTLSHPLKSTSFSDQPTTLYLLNDVIPNKFDLK